MRIRARLRWFPFGPPDVIGQFVAGDPAPRCIVDPPRYVAHWTAKFGRKLRSRVLQKLPSEVRVRRNIAPVTRERLKALRARTQPGGRVVALPSVPPQRIDELREQLSTTVQPLAAAVRHTRKGAVYAALEVER